MPPEPRKLAKGATPAAPAAEPIPLSEHPLYAASAFPEQGFGRYGAPLRTLPATRTGVICNPRSHLNRRAEAAHAPVDAHVALAIPKTKSELTATLADFAQSGIDLLVIDGGDGTVRDVLTHARDAFGPVLPRIAVLPMGKTNALALDLGIPLGWSIDEALAAARNGGIRRRAPIEVLREGSTVPDHRGFLFGAGGFVRATALAQKTHRAGAFNGIAVVLALVWALIQTMFGPRDGEWRRGDRMRLRSGGRVLADHPLYLLLASTFEHFPIGLRPLGPPAPGLKLLAVDAPPRLLPITAPLILLGRMRRFLERLGYRRHHGADYSVSLDGGFILDGEMYPGGDLRLRTGVPLEFVVP